MRILLPLLALLTASSPSTAFAAAQSSLARGVRLYQRGEFKAAKQLLAPLVADPAVAAADRQEARRYLAASLLALKDREGAKQELKKLALEDPASVLDPSEFVPDLVLLDAEARVELRKEQAASRPPPPETRPAQPPPPPLVPVPAAPAQAQPTPAPAPPPAEAGRDALPVAIRFGAFALSDACGPSFGFGLDAGIGWRGLDAALRFVAGIHPGGGVEAGYSFLSGLFVPRAGARFMFVPGVHAVGGGAFAGVRVNLHAHVALTADVGVDYYSADIGYKRLAVPIAAGVQVSL